MAHRPDMAISTLPTFSQSSAAHQDEDDMKTPSALLQDRQFSQENDDDKNDIDEDVQVDATRRDPTHSGHVGEVPKVIKPPIEFSSFGAFGTSLVRRVKSIFTKRFLAVLLAGQFVSFCITSTSIATTQLGINGWALPTTQTLFLYFSLNLIYTPYTIYRYGFKSWAKMLLTDGWKYFILAAIDVEGNYTVVKAYQYTDLLSAMLLDAWATPVCMILTFFLVKARYHWTQILGVLVCIGGLGMLVSADFITDKNYPAQNKVLGDILMLIGATLYGFSNAIEEFFIRKRPLYEVVGMMGFWGTLINGIQAAGLEHNDMVAAPWTGENIGIIMAYTAAMLCLYTMAPLLFRYASSPFYNLSILTSDFYGLLFGLFLYQYSPYWLYFPAYALVIVGLVIYFSTASVENREHDVQARGKRLETKQQAKGGAGGEGRV